MSAEDEAEAVESLAHRLLKRYLSAGDDADAELSGRARWLVERFFGARVSVLQARFSRRLTSSFGNANPQRRTVQVAERLRNAPRWVIDYVLVHEIAHLIEPGHGRRFWELVNRYRYSERAQGYLACLSETEA